METMAKKYAEAVALCRAHAAYHRPVLMLVYVQVMVLGLCGWKGERRSIRRPVTLAEAYPPQWVYRGRPLGCGLYAETGHGGP